MKEKVNIRKRILAVITAATLIIAPVSLKPRETQAAVPYYNAYSVTVKPTYKEISDMYQNTAIVCDKSGKYGIINYSGKTLVKCQYKDIQRMWYSGNYLAQDSQNVWHMINKSGKILATYEKSYDAYESENGFVVCESDSEEMALYKINGEKILSKGEYDTFNSIPGKEQLIVGTYSERDDNYHYYLIDYSGTVLHSYGKYSEVYIVSSDLLLFENDDKDVDKVVTLSGKVIIPESYCIYYFNYKGIGFIVNDKSGKSKLVDSSNKVVSGIENCDDIYSIYETLDMGKFAVRKGTKIQVITYDGKSVRTLFTINGYNSLYTTGDDNYFIATTTSGNISVLDIKGKIIKTFKGYDDVYVRDGLIGACPDYSKGKYDIYSVSGKKLFGKTVALSRLSSNGYYYGSDYEGKYYLYNSSKKLKATFTGLYHMQPGGMDESFFYALNEEGEAGILTRTGKWIIKCGKFDDLMYSNEDYLAYKVKGKWGILKLRYSKEASIKAPAKAKISSVKPGRKKASIKIKKVSGAKGYLIQYSTSKKFKKARKKYTKKKKLTIKKLKSNKKYYFRVKAYKLCGKKKIYSKKWSKVKYITVK